MMAREVTRHRTTTFTCRSGWFGNRAALSLVLDALVNGDDGSFRLREISGALAFLLLQIGTQCQPHFTALDLIGPERPRVAKEVDVLGRLGGIDLELRLAERLPVFRDFLNAILADDQVVLLAMSSRGL